ncbi:protein phosphatase 1 regulatory subunit 36 isoform X6 [Monodelphis domestica]|uniref:protein phosphatase 1 regulatory subunit 36 isoform X6 n=1 Tax=Monodelphis domestica TaxID=13616 RepID=UPI0024E1B94F|nr:protein phosphatase 1 regulatory subunit 36 isoform X6 [Monodelphis domestica]
MTSIYSDVRPSSPPLGRWYWDHETNTLKLKRLSQISLCENKIGPHLSFHLKKLHPMPLAEIKEKPKRGKIIHFAENDGTTSERLSEKRFAKRDVKSTRGTDKRRKNDKVTLDDVKYVALFLLQDTEMQRIYSFTTFMKNKSLDDFLMALLYYLSHYLEKLSLEKKPKTYMAEKVSDTQKDWKFFEAFFTFCTYVAWVVFRRQYLLEIDEEIGRLFRTNMFNSARRRREEEESGQEKRRMNFVQFRRMMAKRPAIKTTVHMRSPALSTLLPSPKEHAQNLFEKSRGQMGVPIQTSNQKELVTYESVAMPIVGILGEPRSMFDTSTLLPNEQEQASEPSKRNASLISENNARVQETLELAMKMLAPVGVLIK